MKHIAIAIKISLILAVLALLVIVLPSLNMDNSFFTILDSAIALLITFFDYARWFIPLNVFVVCFVAMIVVDQWALIFRILQNLVEFVKG